MECRYGVGTERVRSRYGAREFSRGRGVKIALKGPRNLFRGVISLRKNFDFFRPRAPYLLRISTRSRDYNPGPWLVAEFLDLEHTQCPLITKPWKRKLSRKGGGTLEINLRIKHNCHVHIPADEISLSFKLKKFYWLDLSSGWKSDRFCTQNPARPNALCRKVIFLHLFVILFTGGGGVLQTAPRWTPPPTGHGHCSGRHASYWDAFLLPRCSVFHLLNVAHLW